MSYDKGKEMLQALAEKLGAALKKSQRTLVTAESCTGGGLGFYLTSIPGSSEWFERGLITYTNPSKIELLNVSAQTLQQFGAVSKETAEEMAKGALQNSHANLSISVTGIAGPNGGSKEKPVGTVWFGLMGDNMSSPQTSLKIFQGDRHAIRISAIQHAMEILMTSIS